MGALLIFEAARQNDEHIRLALRRVFGFLLQCLPLLPAFLHHLDQFALLFLQILLALRALLLRRSRSRVRSRWRAATSLASQTTG